MTRTLQATPRLNRKTQVKPKATAPNEIEAACLAAIAALRDPSRRYTSADAPGAAAIAAQNKIFDRLHEQEVALWAVMDGDATPAQEIDARAAIADYAPQHCKAAGAMKEFRRCGQTITFQAPSQTRPGVFYLTTHNPTGVTVCNCPATGECWHKRTARELAALIRISEPPLVQIDDLTDAARDKADAPAVSYASYFELEAA